MKKIIIFLLFFPSICLANDFTPIINECANEDFIRLNENFCNDFVSQDNKNYSYNINNLVALHKELKNCSITDENCFKNVVIKMRNLDIDD